jgi:hypothetical protein
MVIDCTHEYLENLNQNQALHSFFKEYPLTEKNLTISIMFEKAHYENFMDPEIFSVDIIEGDIIYDTLVYDPIMDVTSYKNLWQETYEEALSILCLQKPVFDKKSILPTEK